MASADYKVWKHNTVGTWGASANWDTVVDSSKTGRYILTGDLNEFTGVTQIANEDMTLSSGATLKVQTLYGKGGTILIEGTLNGNGSLLLVGFQTGGNKSSMYVSGPQASITSRGSLACGWETNKDNGFLYVENGAYVDVGELKFTNGKSSGSDSQLAKGYAVVDHATIQAGKLEMNKNALEGGLQLQNEATLTVTGDSSILAGPSSLGTGKTADDYLGKVDVANSTFTTKTLKVGSTTGVGTATVSLYGGADMDVTSNMNVEANGNVRFLATQSGLGNLNVGGTLTNVGTLSIGVDGGLSLFDANAYTIYNGNTTNFTLNDTDLWDVTANATEKMFPQRWLSLQTRGNIRWEAGGKRFMPRPDTFGYTM